MTLRDDHWIVRSDPSVVLNIVIILTLLLVPYWALAPTSVTEALRGRLGLTAVFLFTGVGHLIKTVEMTSMLPPWVPGRVPLIYATGVVELVAAIALFVPATSRPTGIFLCLFLIALLPANIYAAFQRVDFGGHAAGPVYLLVRVPLQFLLIGWCYWFAVRSPPAL